MTIEHTSIQAAFEDGAFVVLQTYEEKYSYVCYPTVCAVTVFTVEADADAYVEELEAKAKPNYSYDVWQVNLSMPSANFSLEEL